MAEGGLSAAAAQAADARWHEGRQCLLSGDIDRAVAAFETGLSSAPQHVPMLIGLAEALDRKGRHREPRALLLRAYGLVPDSAPLLFALAQALFRFNAFACVHDLLLRPAFRAAAPPRVLAEAAVLLATIGRADEAMQLVEYALQVEPGNAQALYVRGNLRTFGGDLEGARRDYLATLAARPRMFQAAWMLGTLREATPEENRLDELLRQSAQATPGGHGEQFIRYAIFKEANALGDYALAWRNLTRACAIGRRGSRFDRDAFARMVDRMVATFDGGMLARRASNKGCSTPIFIVGMFRSGTSLLERILAGHPDVADGGETYAFPEEVKTGIDRNFDGAFDEAVLDHVAGIDLERMATGYHANAAWLARGRPMFTEKLPSNFLNVGLIAMSLPTARIIHVRRDAMDTCFANLTTSFSPIVDHVHDQLDVAAYFKGCARLMAHWNTLLPGRILTLDYRDLVEDTAAQARRVADFCGLELDPRMLDVGRSGGSVVTASAAQVRKGIMRGRGGAWRPYAAHLEPMRRALGIEPR